MLRSFSLVSFVFFFSFASPRLRRMLWLLFEMFWLPYCLVCHHSYFIILQAPSLTILVELSNRVKLYFIIFHEEVLEAMSKEDHLRLCLLLWFWEFLDFHYAFRREIVDFSSQRNISWVIWLLTPRCSVTAVASVDLISQGCLMVITVAYGWLRLDKLWSADL